MGGRYYGVQYASTAYVERLDGQGIRISMSATGNPYDNAKAESFFKTLKREEVYLKEYRTFAEAAANIGTCIEDVYNTKRLHSSLGYLPPVEFEATCRLNGSTTMVAYGQAGEGRDASRLHDLQAALG